MADGVKTRERSGYNLRMGRLLIVQTGTTTLHGDYPAWFARALGFAMPVVRAHEGERLGPALDRERPQGIVVTGSPSSVTERAPWMLDLGEDLLRIGARGTPVLGVCFGHQLLARAAGGDVVVNPRGREIGTVKVRLTDAGRRDPLFAWAAQDEIEVQATHLDAVDPLPPGATLLASNENCAAQAFRLSETLAGVQFHPELWAGAMRDSHPLAQREARRRRRRPCRAGRASPRSRGRQHPARVRGAGNRPVKRALQVDRFLADPVGRYFVGKTHVVWCASATLLGSFSWGRPTEDDARELTRLFDLSRHPKLPRFDVVTDSAGIEAVGWGALSVLREYVKARLPDWGRQIRRQAAIVPPGPMGLILAGLVPLLGMTFPMRFFSARGDAVGWLVRDDAAAALQEVEAIADEARGVSPLVRALRDHLEGALLDASVESAARALIVTPRSLQRELKRYRTSFSLELASARVRAGSMLLQHSDDKIEAVARKVGCSSASHFAALFRKSLGETPAQYRARQREPSRS